MGNQSFAEAQQQALHRPVAPTSGSNPRARGGGWTNCAAVRITQMNGLGGLLPCLCR